MSSDFSVELNAAQIDDLRFHDGLPGLLQDIGDEIADAAASRAPRDTGEGAQSIHAEVAGDAESLYVDVGWDPDAFYLYFHEVGTEKQPAQPFLRPALDATDL